MGGLGELGLTMLKVLKENRKRETLYQNHEEEMGALERAHMLEVKELLTKWNSIIMPNFENEAALLELELKRRQQNEVEMFRQQPIAPIRDRLAHARLAVGIDRHVALGVEHHRSIV